MNKKNYFVLICLAAFLNSFTAFATVVKAPLTMEEVLQDTYKKFKSLKEGKNADYIPELAKVNPNYFAIVIATVDGKVMAVGDADVPFAIESVVKPFLYAQALADQGEQFVSDKVGLNATGDRYNSIVAIEERPNHLQNPLVNPGAIQINSLIKGSSPNDKWERSLKLIQDLSDGKPTLGQAVYESETATNQRNRAITELLQVYHMMYSRSADTMHSDSMDALDRYTKACSIMVTTKQLAMMGATLANGGVNPFNHKQVIAPQYVRNVLSQMVTNGMYDTSGAWWFYVGLPAKSGVGGGIIAVVPNKMAIAAFSPPVDAAGNSVRAQAAIAELSKRWQLHLLT